MDFSHAAVWIDHQKVTIVHFNADTHSIQHIRNPRGGEHLHHKAGALGSGHESNLEPFFALVAQALATSGEVLVVGPGTARTEFLHYLDRHNPPVRKHVLGTEAADQMSEPQLLALARKWFNPVDNMRGTGLR